MSSPTTPATTTATTTTTTTTGPSAPVTTAPTITTTTTTSNKRAHEDTTLNNGPEAKRPALDPESKDAISSANKTASPVPEVKTEGSTPVPASTKETAEVKIATPKTPEVKDEQGDTSVSDAPQQAQQSEYVPVDESKWIHIRAIISSQEAATVIGKGGENVTMIRRMSAAKCTVSDYARGAVERILTVSGSVDAVAKVCFPP